MRTGCHYLRSLYVCPSVYSLRVTFEFRGFYWLREVYDADFHKPGIYRSGQVLVSACDVFRRTPSRGGRGRRVAVHFVVCFRCGGISCFQWFLHFLIRTYDLWIRETESSQRRLGDGVTTASQSAHRDLAPTGPHQVYHLLCYHLRIMALVDQ